MRAVYCLIAGVYALLAGFFWHEVKYDISPNRDGVRDAAILMGVYLCLIMGIFGCTQVDINQTLKRTFDTSLEVAHTLTVPGTTTFVAMHYSGILPLYDPLDYGRLQSLSSPDTHREYIQRLLATVSQLSINRNLANLILEYAIEVHIVCIYEDEEQKALLYQGLDAVEADRLITPNRDLYMDPAHSRMPVFWNMETLRFERTNWNASRDTATYKEPGVKWLLRLSAPVNPKLLYSYGS